MVSYCDDVADERREQAGCATSSSTRGDASGKPRDRHAYVGDDALGAGAQGHGRPERVVARLPQPVAILARVAHWNVAPRNRG